jgi:adenosine deaminase
VPLPRAARPEEEAASDARLGCLVSPGDPQTPQPPGRGGPLRGSAPKVGLLEASEWLARTLVSPDDFARVAYEAQEDAWRQSNVVYRELFFEPGWFLGLGVAYPHLVDGLTAGLRAAEADFGVVGRLVAGIDRRVAAGAARELAEQVVTHPRPEVVGIGLEGSELLGPPERFAEAYRLAGRHGLHRTAHAGEHVPTAEYVLACLDLGRITQMAADGIEASWMPDEDKRRHRHELAAEAASLAAEGGLTLGPPP